MRMQGGQGAEGLQAVRSSLTVISMAAMKQPQLVADHQHLLLKVHLHLALPHFASLFFALPCLTILYLALPCLAFLALLSVDHDIDLPLVLGKQLSLLTSCVRICHMTLCHLSSAGRVQGAAPRRPHHSPGLHCPHPAAPLANPPAPPFHAAGVPVPHMGPVV